MKNYIELDFSNEIKAKNLDNLTYTKTPNAFLETANSNFKYMDININPLLNFPPPKNSSPETKKELMQIKSSMESEHPEEFKLNLKEMNEDPALFIINHYKKISGKNIPNDIFKFISDGDVEVLAMKLKMHYNRPRPYQYNKSLQVLYSTTADTPAYPAGHALQAYYLAKILGKKYPYIKSQLDNIAYQCDIVRVKAGLHYPSDGQFSKVLIDTFF